MAKIIGTLEARMGSSRLVGKTLMEVDKGKSLLECVVSRFRACSEIDDVVVATTVEPLDDLIADWCMTKGVKFFRGSENDVLERVVAAATHYDADAIVQMGADSAYLDPALIDQLVSLYRQNEVDYVCNDQKLTWPLGVYGHVVRVSTLLRVTERADLTANDRSDVVRYIFERPKEFRILAIEAPAELRCPELRLTVDYLEDMEQARKVYSLMGHSFTTAQVIDLFRNEPSLFAKTARLIQQSAPFLAEK